MGIKKHIYELNHQPIKNHNQKDFKRIIDQDKVPMYHFYRLKHIFFTNFEHTILFLKL